MNDFKKQDQPMLLTSLLAGVNHSVIGDIAEIKINNICYDSRKVSPGSLFVCLPGAMHDGHEFAPDAI
ncbi:MAG: Mur ligase domain-containing protein, partial [Eubacteriales bacterium]|nr:Mur ligase domain-containing protein [Eubacteriales bacterium]